MGKRGKASKAKKLGTEFRDFITKGNVISLAVGVIIGGAFQAVINSAVSDVFLPIIGAFTKEIDFSAAFIDLTRIRYPSKDVIASASAAIDAGRVVVSYGSLITAVINFLIIGLVVFLIVKSINSVGDVGKKVRRRGKAAPEKPAPTVKECPFCCSEIAIKATRCPHCTSQLPAEAEEMAGAVA
ncbi:MAG: large conductance mechanosensitive channel protein MscL [Firmicutes bacterium]|nr:large conductance mechanosensitive channel protein MscL [Bacillota bacterium]